MDEQESALNNEKDDCETNENDILQVEIDSQTYSGKTWTDQSQQCVLRLKPNLPKV